MKCPYCSHEEDKVVETRSSKDGDVTRRRRECLKCAGRFTTHEFIEESLPTVIKKDNRREPFDRIKILNGIKKACEKRPVSMNTIEEMIRRIERTLQEKYEKEKEIKSSLIGELIMLELHMIDEIAYIRFASVYRQFKDVNEFKEELDTLLNKKSI